MAIITYAKALNDALREELNRDNNIFLLGEDIGTYGGCFGVTKGLTDEFEGRVLDTPISEQGYTGAAVGAALAGLRPVCELMFSDFITVCFDIVANEAGKIPFMLSGKTSLPVTFRAPCGCGKGAAAQHSQSLEALFAHMPGLNVVMPATPYDAKGMLKTAIRTDEPVLFLEPKMLYETEGEVPKEEYTLPLGKADIKKSGKDVSIITYGRTLPICLEAADEIAMLGIEAEVIDLRSLYPFDKETVFNSVKKTGNVIVCHEAITFGGFGAEIVAEITEGAFEFLKKAPVRLGAPRCPVPMAKHLEDECCPKKDDVIKAIMQLAK